MFEVDGWKVSFKHFRDDQLDFATNYGFVSDRVTDASVCAVDKGPITKYGLALCHEMDQFSKAVGRKIALTRALRTFDKEFRTKVWEAYFERVKK